MLAWRDPPAPSRPASPPSFVDEHDVELLLFEVVPPPTHPSGWEPENSRLHVDGAVFLSGAVTSTVLGVTNADHGIDVRAPALPVTVSRSARFQSVTLEIIVRDCTAARRWTPVDRPFTITWRDEHGMRHLDRAGDFDRSLARSLTRYIDAVCDNAARKD